VGFAVFLLVKAVNEAMTRARRRQEVAEEAAAEPTIDERLLVTLERLNTTLDDLNRRTLPPA